MTIKKTLPPSQGMDSLKSHFSSTSLDQRFKAGWYVNQERDVFVIVGIVSKSSRQKKLGEKKEKPNDINGQTPHNSNVNINNVIVIPVVNVGNSINSEASIDVETTNVENV